MHERQRLMTNQHGVRFDSESEYVDMPEDRKTKPNKTVKKRSPRTLV